MHDNRYLRDRAYRRGMGMRDGRNPYGSRGGYVTSRRGRGRDRAMDYEHDYPERDSRYIDRNYDQHHYPRNNMGSQQYGEYPRHMDYEMYGYGIGGIRPMMNDYGYGRDYASEDMEKEWKEHLEKWCKELKRYDRFGMSKDQLIQSAKQMGVSFDKYDEKEFLTTYYMVMSDYPQIAHEPHTYLAMAKEWLEDKDSNLKGSEKLCAYYYEVVKGGEED